MAPHAIETILQPPQWPLGLSQFVTWCLMWDPKNRPTSRQAMDHEFFADAVDPLRPKSSSRLLGRKHSDLSFRSKETTDSPTIHPKPSWFRRSLIARESAPVVPQHNPDSRTPQQESEGLMSKIRPQANKRATWANTSATGAAPMPILPSIRPISPLPNAVHAQAQPTNNSQHIEARVEQPLPPPPPQAASAEDNHKKIGRQLSINSHGNHYPDAHRQEAERALNANSGLVSPPYQKESFFSHLRKRARRFSGRHGLTSPGGDDVEANAVNVPWSNRSSMIVDSIIPESQNDFSDLDKMLQSVRYSLEHADDGSKSRTQESLSNQGSLKRTHSVPRSQASQSGETNTQTITPVSSRPRRTIQLNQYEPPAEEDELLDEALRSANRAARRLEPHQQRNILAQRDLNRQPLPAPMDIQASGGYPTPSPSAKKNGVQFNASYTNVTQPLNIVKKRPEQEHVPPHWPTPPYEENEWATSAAASVYATQSGYR
jgi:meiosis induction protein kinase IME2/SME1